MPYPRRGPATPNTIKLTLDFRTFDKLQAVAKSRNQPSDRCAYELLQQILDRIDTPTTTPTAEQPDPVGDMLVKLNLSHKPQERS